MRYMEEVTINKISEYYHVYRNDIATKMSYKDIMLLYNSRVERFYDESGYRIFRLFNSHWIDLRA